MAGGPPVKIKRPASVLVKDFFDQNQELLKLRLVGSDEGLSRRIMEPSVNRPGLALNGFFTYFAYKRIQVIGNSEISFLQGLEPSLARTRISQLCSQDIPCVVVARGRSIPPDLVEIANEAGISILQTSMVTMKFLNAATIRLEWMFAPTCLVHGCLVDVQGIGVMVQGDSGSGKSEAVIGLLQRGASLVADDVVELYHITPQTLEARCPEMLKDFLEVRGLGMLNIRTIFGETAVRTRKNLKLIVQLERPVQGQVPGLERLPLHATTDEIMGVAIRKVQLPVAAGRNLAVLVEAAVRNYVLQLRGIDSTQDFIRRQEQHLGDAAG
jgi:HPr kinase/phosphorylase